jgi:uncharacterized protein (TIGR03790 family)
MRLAFRPVLLAACLAIAGTSAWGLEPGDVAVVFNTKSPASLQIARYYLNARHLPQDRLIPLTCEPGDWIPEKDYRTTVVPQLLKALKDRDLLPDEKAGKAGIRCLVTTYDVPLKIGPIEPSVVERGEIAEYERQLAAIAEDLAAQVLKFDALARSAAVPATTTVPAATATNPSTTTAAGPTAAAKPTSTQILPKVDEADRAAAQRILKLPEAERDAAVRQFMAILEHLGGSAALLSALPLRTDPSMSDAARQKLAQLTADVRDGRAQLAALAPQKESARIRREIVAQRLKIEGVVGQAGAIEEMIHHLRPEQTSACFDNELMLLLADQSYAREGWVANPMCLDVYAPRRRGPQSTSVPKVLMVCRLDGSSVAKVQEMIDTGLKVEEQGLAGKMYIDARDLHGTDPHSSFDAELRKTADWLKAHSTMETVLEDTGKLLAAKDAPEAAVYCGWYSLNNYQDSGQWVKGAVGYHVASGEMVSLHNPKETGWVVNLLNRGFCGTLGPTEEPYLHSFPKPSQFFPLLLSGDFSQGEVWLLTCPLLSWRQGFVGDPLYNPFKKNPRVKTEDLKADGILRCAYEELGK